jgi:type I restriction enzyme M protein
MAKNKTTTAANLGFEATLWSAADKLRNNMDAAEYKHVVLGLIFLKYISDSFEELHTALQADPEADAEDEDEYLSKNVFWVPKQARWDYIQSNAKQTTIGSIIDDAMDAIEKENKSLH